MPTPVPLSAVAESLRRAGLLVAQRGAMTGTVAGVSQDSRSVRDGDLFLAWKGTAHDSHDFVETAADGGAAAAVVERPVTSSPIPQLHVSDGRTAASVAADRVFGSPWTEMELVAVTGTNGKTTTVLLARHLLEGAGSAAALGTLGLVGSDGSVRPGTEGLTTPGPVQFSGWLRSLADEDVETVVLEASSHALEQRRLDGVRFGTAVFTNLSRDHLDYHGTLEAYFAAKARLLGLVRADGCVVVHGGVEAWRTLPVGQLETLTYGTGPDSDLRAVDVALGPDESRFGLEWKGRTVDVRLPLLGAFNVENALAAAGVGLAAGLTLEQVAAGLHDAPQVPGRLERVLHDPFTVLIDYAHTPDALGRVTRALDSLGPGRLTVLFGAGGDRDREKRPLMAEAVAGVADRIVVTSDNPRTEDPDAIIDAIIPGLGGAEHVRITDRAAAIRYVLDTAEPGEIVLLAGKGHERYQEVDGVRHSFDERQHVLRWVDGGEED